MTFTVQITPNAPRSEIAGWLGDKLKIKIKAQGGPPQGYLLFRAIAGEDGLRIEFVTFIRELHT